MLEDADGEAEGIVDGTHPLSVTFGQIVVHCHQMGSLACKCVEIEGEGGNERLSLASLHLRDLALVEDDAPGELHIEVAQAGLATRGLPHGGEGLRQEVIQRLA